MSAPRPKVPRYAARIARLPQVFERLAAHPDGLPLEDLAAGLGIRPEELRDDLLAFYTADVSADWLLGLARPDVLEFLGADGAEADPADAQVVRFVEEHGELGVEYVDAAELALVHSAATTLLEVEPDNTELAAALGVLGETMLGAPGAELAPATGASAVLPLLRRAVEERRTARIVYSRAWAPGVSERDIEPYRLVQTRRGWEVDAGPVGTDGSLRTFLLSHLRAVELREQRFEVGSDVPARLAAQRATRPVRICLPQEARWAADFYAESVTVIQDDEESVVVQVDLLPPIDHRVGLILLAAGAEAFVVEPRSVEDAGARVAAELLEHHRVEPDLR